MELLTQSTGLEEWKLLFDHLDIINERIFTLKNIYKVKLESMLDAELSSETNGVISLIEETMQNFAKAMDGAPLSDLILLQLASEKLGDTLIDFRSKKITRQYELTDVESFFVFFYTLKALVNDLQKTRKHLSILLS